MELRQLESFARVAELGSFTRAAQALGIAQPALSRQIRQLEVELHQHLLVRNGRGVTPTEAGQLLLEHCRGILHQVRRAVEDMARVQGALAGRVVLGLPPSASKMLTVPLTRQFRAELPSATLSIGEGLSFVMQEWLLAGRLDIALLYNPNPSPELVLEPLTSERLVLVGPRGEQARAEPLPLRALAEVPLVIPNRPHTVRMLLEAQMAQIGARPNVRLEIDGVAAILDLVADGAGHAVLTRQAMLTSTQPDRFVVRPIVQPDIHSHLYLATASSRIATQTQRVMQRLIHDTVRAVYPADTVPSSA